MFTLHLGDALSHLRTLPAESIQCCVTSPPYFGLRDYGHEGQVGLEPTPHDYVASLIEVFEEVRRVLKKDGVCFLNLGDSYVSSPRGNKPGDHSTASLTNPKRQDTVPREKGKKKDFSGLKPKDLIGIPWRTAFALQSAGWYLRQDIIWAKPNPMPESVTDRCTKAHEYLFLLTKSAKYYYDHEAVKEPCSEDMQRRAAKGHTRGPGGKVDASRQDGDTLRGEHAKKIDTSKGRNKRSVWTVTTKSYKGCHFATFPPDLIRPCILAGTKPGDTVLDPFAGSGTTGQVALEHDRNAILIELNPDYEPLIRQRCAPQVNGFKI